LGLKQLEPDPWTVFTQKYNPGDIIQGRVRSITDYGVFVGIEDGVDGMVHKSDVSWTQRINNPADLYRKGDEVEAIILSINHDDRKVSLGIKQLYEDPWSFVPARYPEGTVVEVRSTGADEYGVHVELERGVEGVIPRGEISADLSQEPTDIVKTGDIVKAQVIRLDDDDRTITLSLRAAEGQDVNQVARPEEAQKRVAPRKIGPSLGGAQATLGDALKDKLGALNLTASEEEASAEAPEEAPAEEAPAEEAPAEAEEAPAEAADAEEKPE
jgi:small subunit ribosomal protein S1